MSSRLKLVGMLDSPFVRRVAIALEHYGFDYENLSISVFRNVDEFARYSPLKRAPTLVLENGEVLVDSHLILDHLDELAAPELCLIPKEPARRLACRQIVGVAAGLADKAVSAFYELKWHPPEHRNQQLLERNRAQLADSLAWLEARAPRKFVTGDELSHADVMVGAAVRFGQDALPELFDLGLAPAVRGWCERLEALPIFRRTYLPFN